MASSGLRIGIIGGGPAARVHLNRLVALAGVRVVGCADPDLDAARALAAGAPASEAGPVAAFADHRDLLREVAPDALAIFTPHLAHYRPAMDALQAGCHVFIEKPLSTNVQEAADIVNLARGRGLKVGVGHQYRLAPSLLEARRRLSEGALGPVRLVTAALARPWAGAYGESEGPGRPDPGGGFLADAGDQLLDTLLWTTGRAPLEVAAVQDRLASGIDRATAAVVRLEDGTPATLALSGASGGSWFELTYFGERGRLRATDTTLVEERDGLPGEPIPLPGPRETIDGNFVAAVLTGAPLCCPADQALMTVRLQEAIARSTATGQVVRLA